jgi:hypothetical protein
VFDADSGSTKPAALEDNPYANVSSPTSMVCTISALPSSSPTSVGVS